MKQLEANGVRSIPGVMLSRAIILWAVLFAFFQLMLWPRYSEPNDWTALWVAGEFFAQGRIDQIYAYYPGDFSRIADGPWREALHNLHQGWNGLYLEGHPFVHAPIVAIVMGLVTKVLTFSQSVMLLLFLSSFMLVIMIAAAYFMWMRRSIPLLYLIVASLVFVTTEPAQFSLYYGQTSLLIYGGLILGVAISKRHPWAAGILLGLVSIVKISPIAIIVMLFLFQGRRKAGAVGLASTALGFGLSYLLGGRELWQAWLDTMGRIGNEAIISFTNVSYTSVRLIDLHDPLMRGATVVTDPPIVLSLLPMAFFATLAALTYLVVVVRQVQAFPMLISQAIIISMMTPSIVWYHYFVALPVVVLGILVTRSPQWVKYPLVFFGVSMFYSPFIGFDNPWLSIDRPYQTAPLIVGSVFVIALIALYYVDARWGIQEDRQIARMRPDESVAIAHRRAPLLHRMFNLPS
ncbi:glycosyltransferase family 87 protein [Corynebacterium uterequi]|uniref:Putative DUF2029 family protein n=1 Tax=Corynebacterium uterequi TaxID=1072256 RepID=A0A0G3H9Q6_9CORY|nr:glycosyltransferase family 87 protein [Corynebacterium uterequi]AKK10064.1 putative DUF2029 family protein [Corynebacterium uterequi]